MIFLDKFLMWQILGAFSTCQANHACVNFIGQTSPTFRHFVSLLRPIPCWSSLSCSSRSLADSASSQSSFRLPGIPIHKVLNIGCFLNGGLSISSWMPFFKISLATFFGRAPRKVGLEPLQHWIYQTKMQWDFSSLGIMQEGTRKGKGISPCEKRALRHSGRFILMYIKPLDTMFISELCHCLTLYPWNQQHSKSIYYFLAMRCLNYDLHLPNSKLKVALYE